MSYSHVQAGGAVIGRTNTIPIRFKYTGNDRLFEGAIKNFEQELNQLLQDAGFAGSYTVYVQTKVKGRPHTQGLRVHSPDRFGITLTWHEGSNDNCIKLSLSVPNGMDRFAFHGRLKRAERGEDDDGVVENCAPPNNLSLADQRPNNVVPLTPIATKPQRFVDEPVFVEIFLTEARRFRAPRGGHECVSRPACVLILTEQCQVDSPDEALCQLTEEGYLREVEEGRYFVLLTQPQEPPPAVLASTATATAEDDVSIVVPASANPKPAPSKPDAFAIAAEKAAEQSTAAVYRFFENEELVLRFFGELNPFIDPVGLVRREATSMMLKQTFNYQRTGAVCESLVMRGLLEIVDDVHYRVAQLWLDKIRPSKAAEPLVRQPSSTAVDATIAAQVPRGSGKPSRELAALAEVRQKAHTARTLRARLAEVDSEIANLDSLKQKAEERRARIVGSLARPDLKSAEEQYAAIQRVLGLEE